jgi:hypothetical protein
MSYCWSCPSGFQGVCPHDNSPYQPSDEERNKKRLSYNPSIFSRLRTLWFWVCLYFNKYVIHPWRTWNEYWYPTIPLESDQCPNCLSIGFDRFPGYSVGCREQCPCYPSDNREDPHDSECWYPCWWNFCPICHYVEEGALRSSTRRRRLHKVYEEHYW